MRAGEPLIAVSAPVARVTPGNLVPVPTGIAPETLGAAIGTSLASPDGLIGELLEVGSERGKDTAQAINVALAVSNHLR